VVGNDEQNKSRLLNNLAWGNWCDFKIKTGVDNFHVAERCVGLGLWSIPISNVHHSLIGRAGRTWLGDSIVCGAETNLEADGEFADPAGGDYRLQSTSRFRGKAPDGSDRGPYAYQTNVFYAGPEGADKADGLSVRTAWKTLGRAVQSLRPGDTLYLQPGIYTGDVELSLRGTGGAPVSIRGRGRHPVVVEGALQIRDSVAVDFKRLYFNSPVTIAASPSTPDPRPSFLSPRPSTPVTFENCQFMGNGTAMEATGLNGLRVTHCVFTGFKQAALDLKDCSNVHLSGNLYDNRKGVALRMDRADAVAYSDYNSYRRAATAGAVGRRTVSLADLQAGRLPSSVMQDPHAQTLIPEWHVVQGVGALKNPLVFAALGPLGRPMGLYRDEGRLESMRLVKQPTVHSVSATTANLEWMVSRPATCELEWGDMSGNTHTNTFHINHFGTFSLTGLKPGHTYHFSIRSLQAPDDMTEGGATARIELKDEPLTFTTLKEAKAPAVYYVAPDGNDASTGLTRQRAWKTVQHAASTVNAGDTVRIAGGIYPEQVRVRATGESQAPITFTCMTGEKVVMSGAAKTLSNGFIVAGKSHLRFDGLYFSDFNFDPSHGWLVSRAGDFNLYNSRDIRITRCFSDGRNGYTARSITAWQVEDLLISNCVNLNKMSGALDILRCPNLRLEHTVFGRPMINSFVLNNTADQKAIMENNIFTDMLEKKAALNAGFAELEDPASLQLKNNCFTLRCFPPDKRIVFADVDHSVHKATRTFTLPEWDSAQGDTRTLFADPAFAGDPGNARNPADKTGFSPERMMDPALALDFNSFFATNPEVIKRGIGLQPEAFKDFSFERKQPAGK
jgi:hypothetical protein